MTTATENQILRKNLEKYEGRVNHMYLDSLGYVTVGIGHLLPSLSSAQAVKFRNSKGMPATKDEIRVDYENIKKQAPNRLAGMYKRFTKLTLPNSEVDRLTDDHIKSFETELRSIYSGFDTFPRNARLALFDLIFNLGMPALKNKWPLLNAVIAARDWKKAADNSRRAPPVSAERNVYVKKLFESCASPAKQPHRIPVKP
ncbi:glycoside hydrolase family protein [Gilvimarinus sp. F26214L]|uniref:glycoside hydrolase family protein n=1 Tax=Gilvimarinus sp. DZF01 TaxID=3461371 RepID=UPI004046020E